MVNEKSVKKYLAVLVIVFLAVVVLWALGPFVNALFGGLILATLLITPHEYLTNKLGWNRKISSLLVMLLSFFIIIIPLFGILFIIGNEVQDIIQNPQIVISAVESVDNLIPHLDLQTKVKEFIPQIGKEIVTLITGFVAKIGQVLFMLFMSYFLVYYLLSAKKETRHKYIYAIIPFSKNNSIKLIEKFGAIVNSTMKSTGIIAVVQGVLLTILFLVLSVPGAFTWGFVGAIMSFLPAVGAFVIWVPAVIILLVKGEIVAAIIMAIGGVLISVTDNFLRPMLQKGGVAKLHPFTTLLGVFMGLSAFGLIGLIVGPLLLTFLFMTIKMFREEYVK